MVKKKTIFIPTMNDGEKDFNQLFILDKNLRDVANCNNPEILQLYFDFSNCSFLRQNGVAYLAAISNWLKTIKGYKIYYKMGTVNEKVMKMFIDDGFLQAHFSEHVNGSKPINVNSIKFSQFRGDLNSDEELSQKIIEYINNDWLKSDWIHLQDKLKLDITVKMYELFANALEHSKSELGCFTCGQKYKEPDEIVFSIVDLGIGIVGSVKNYFQGEISNVDAMRWAFTNENTTRKNNTGGLGLNLIQDFLELNKGEMVVYCNAAKYEFNAGKVLISDTDYDFSGTIINIRLRSDNNFYSYRQ